VHPIIFADHRHQAVAHYILDYIRFFFAMVENHHNRIPTSVWAVDLPEILGGSAIAS
jgi:hypothetical protein